MRVRSRAHPPKTPAKPSPAAKGEPRLPTGKDVNGEEFSGLHYDRVGGDVFIGGASPDDVAQGRLGDCYFLASLAAVAKNHPELIKRAIHENKDGTFTVTFKEKGRSVPITVDADFPAGSRGGQVFGRGLDVDARGPELWPAIFEKAFAQWKGGYQNLNQGGYADDVLPTLTGKGTIRKSLAGSPDKLWETLNAAAKAGEPIVTGTPSAAELKRRTGQADMAGLLDDHDYAILGCREQNGYRLVELYTPLAPGDCGVTGGQQRTLTLSLEDYQKLFDDLVIGKL
jgi:hypothetical protein